ncbi:BamA/TamA family outer membrane protein [Flavisolibacter tropicus]|uniref:Bacterial surface antigen (D15) domain-containing protein n=1 Tax=Flavisolibacter tropicus TaxID=1492898 RepID=A0A172TWS3_9BACT|nr:BamA/TamA family outer membrane protein [Flavisolibacter tropicus]ANE51539.1 hypothetical protein SY85_14525 [Flavisolibacter tropicus]
MNTTHSTTAVRHWLYLAAAILLFSSQSIGQSAIDDASIIANINRQKQYKGDSVYVLADAAFQKVPTTRWFLGDHYRREWITPIKVPVIDIDTLYGGLVVKKEGGGKQTKSLQLKSKTTGQEYTIRTVEKFPEKALPEEFAGTVAVEFVKDQVSSAHPYAPLVVADLAKAGGIYRSNPKFVFVKRSSALGEFDSTFGNQFYLMEERPQGNWEGNPLFGNAERIFSTEKMQESLLKPKYKADSRAFLRARLLDMFIGDWDRHEDQWTWGVRKQDGLNYIYPIPKDRDQAFAKLDGVVPWLGTRKWALRKAKYFKEDIEDMKGLMWQAKNLDRLILVDLTWPEWEKEGSAMQTAWTDNVITQAVNELPASVKPLNGQDIQQKLMHRRDDLMKYTKEYYKILSKEVEWMGTDNADKFVISSTEPSTFTIKHYALDKEGYLLKKERVFNSSETKEVRLYGMNGDDQFQIEPNTRLKSRIRLIGGYGNNSYTNATGSKLSKVYAYDTSLKKNSEVKKEFKIRTRPDSLWQQYTYGNYQYDIVLPFFLPGYNPDDGVFLGGGINYRKYKWNKPGLAAQHRIAANYAFESGAYNFLYEGFFAQVVGRWNVLANFYLNQPDYVLNFYGLGNNTEKLVDDKSFYRIRVEQLVAVAGLQRSWAAKHHVSILGDYLSTQVQEVDKRFVTSAGAALDSSAFDRVHWVGGTVSYLFSTRNDSYFPTHGVAVESAIQYHYSPTRSDNYSNYAGAFTFYLPIRSLVWTSRIGGAILSGDPQFFQYNQLSGLTNLRGYRRSRFSGKSMVYNNNELRIPVATLKGFVVRGKLGINLFCDNGRVWIPDEDSNRWHVGYGGGVWIVPYQRISFTANYGVSKEDQVLYIKAGFMF